ncbi:MAG: amidohydrolase [Gammaproteobacteria bacterium]|nr:amidohydrolase [Gammaproteobacteria bacterium]
MRVAAAQYPIENLHTWSDIRTKLERWVHDAVTNGAKLLVFPEYFSLEITAIFGEAVCQSLPLSLEKLQRTLADFLNLFRDLAQTHHVYICAGSYPVQVGDGRYANRSYFFWPTGHCEFQEKLQMTRFELEQWGVTAGQGLKVFVTEFGKIAINVCYDSEFPLLARHQIEQGAGIILVPSCTDSLAGYHRVRIGCQARALENQCYVVQSPTVGDCPWSAAVDTNIGAAGFYTPVDHGFPANGLLARGELNKPQWVYADLKLAELARIRAEGQVFNYRDWSGQYAHLPKR